MSRLMTLWLLYIAGHEVGRYISLEKIIVTVFQGFQAISHGEELFDFLVVDQKHG